MSTDVLDGLRGIGIRAPREALLSLLTLRHPLILRDSGVSHLCPHENLARKPQVNPIDNVYDARVLWSNFDRVRNEGIFQS